MRTSVIWRNVSLFGLVLMVLGAGGLTAAPIGVDVDSQAISFQGAPPLEVKGSVLVPLRGVFEALGATVNYDAPTKTITAAKGTTSVILQVGSTSASVNGQTKTLSQPAQESSGTTLVPLRFVAQALGAEVDWNESINTVQIFTKVQNLATLPVPVTPKKSGKAKILIARVVKVDMDSNPQQIIVFNGKDTVVRLTSSTVIELSVQGRPKVKTTLSKNLFGDQARIQRDSSGNAVSLTLLYVDVRGTVQGTGQAANGDSTITFQNGQTVEMARGALFARGTPFNVLILKTGETVDIRTNPRDKLGYGIKLGAKKL